MDDAEFMKQIEIQAEKEAQEEVKKELVARKKEEIKKKYIKKSFKEKLKDVGDKVAKGFGNSANEDKVNRMLGSEGKKKDDKNYFESRLKRII